MNRASFEEYVVLSEMEAILRFPPVNGAIMRHLRSLDRANFSIALNDYSNVRCRGRRKTEGRYAKERGEYKDHVLLFLQRIEVTIEQFLTQNIDAEQVNAIVVLPVEHVQSLFGLGDESDPYVNRPVVPSNDMRMKIYVEIARRGEQNLERTLNALYASLLSEFPDFPLCVFTENVEFLSTESSLVVERYTFMKDSSSTEVMFYKFFTTRMKREERLVKWCVVMTKDDFLAKKDFPSMPDVEVDNDGDNYQRLEEDDVPPEYVVQSCEDGSKYVNVEVARLLNAEFIPPPMNKKSMICFKVHEVPAPYKRVVFDFVANRVLLKQTQEWWSSEFYEPIFLYRYSSVPFSSEVYNDKFGEFLRCLIAEGILNKNFVYPMLSVDEEHVVLATRVTFASNYSCHSQMELVTCEGESLRCCEPNIRLFLNSCARYVEKTMNPSNDFVKLFLETFRGLYHVFSCHAVLNPFASLERLCQ